MANWRMLIVAAFAVGVSCLYAAENMVTLEGTLVSSGCYLGRNQVEEHNNDKGKPCGRACLEGGDPAGLLTNEKEFHVLVIPSIPLAPYVGQHVRVVGHDHNGVIGVHKVEVMKDGKWEEINLHPKT